MKTINQINSFVERDQTINFYRELCTDEARWNSWKNRSFDFCYFYNGQKHEHRVTPAGNWIYGQAVRQLCRYRGTDDFYNYERDHRSAKTEITFNCYTLEFRLSLEIGLNGIQLIVQTNFKPFERYQRFAVRSNLTFETFDIADYFQKRILPKYLYAEGLFRNIQVMRNCSKKEALEFYLQFVKPAKQEKEFIDTEKAWKHLFLKRLNIEIADDLSERLLPRLFNTLERQKTRRKLFKHPSPFELSDMYSSEFDTDGHEEEFLDGIYSDYPKNAMFI